MTGLRPALFGLSLVLISCAGTVAMAQNLRFEVATFNATPEGSDDHFNQAMFDRLNTDSPFGGYHFGMGSDAHRAELAAKGNALAVYHNSLTGVYTSSAHDPVAAADEIDFYVRDRFTDFGAAPRWLTLNEISASLWTNATSTGQTYRTWLTDTAARLHDHYGYEVIVFSPFSNPGANDASWQALTQHAYIGVEHYLSGAEVRDNGFSVAWAQSMYESSQTSYRNRGVSEDRLFITEHFAQTVAGTDWGRAGVSADDWERAIRVRDQAILGADFAGFLSFAWGKNGMGVSDAELNRFIDAHMSMPVLASEVPEPAGCLVLLGLAMTTLLRSAGARRARGWARGTRGWARGTH